MTDRKEVSSPKLILQNAIEELDVFTQSNKLRLDLGENGRLLAIKHTRLERIMNLALTFVGSLLPTQVKVVQAKKMNGLKEAILRARDTIQSHLGLIEKYKEGDDSQRSLADYALSAIQRYNSMVGQDSFPHSNSDPYNYERHCLLRDNEIKGLKIELPHAVSIKYDSHPENHPAKRVLKELSQTFLLRTTQKKNLINGSTHKKTIQFMIDTFRMKVIRMIQMHLSQNNEISEILPLIKNADLEIDDESSPELVLMRQLIEFGPGSLIMVSGCFKKKHTDSQFLTLPILDSFRLSFQISHSGFPYPSQHTGWSLADKWIDALPLRNDQVPQFHKVNEKRKQLIQQLLFNPQMIQKTRRRTRLKREIFDQHRDIFIPLHRRLQELLYGSFKQESFFETHYINAFKAPSAFDFLVRTQQQVLDLFTKLPLKALEEEWLSDETSLLRTGSPSEKFQIASLQMEQYRKKTLTELDLNNVDHQFIYYTGLKLGKDFQAIALQYQSEKMGFSPPLLNDFQRRIQACAFQQLISFLNECENRLNILDPDEIKNELVEVWNKDLQILQSNKENSNQLVFLIVDELEFYFNSRFHSLLPKINAYHTH